MTQFMKTMDVKYVRPSVILEKNAEIYVEKGEKYVEDGVSLMRRTKNSWIKCHSFKLAISTERLNFSSPIFLCGTETVRF